MARSFLMLFILSLAFSFSANGELPFRIQKESSSSGEKINVLEFPESIIDNTSWQKWRYSFSELDPNLDTLIIFNSPGGTVPGGTILIHHIEVFLGKQKENGRRVAILSERECSSMCIPVFFTLDHRYSLAETKFGFHGVDLGGGLGHDSVQTDLYLKQLKTKAKERNQNEFIDWLDQQIESGVFANHDLTSIKGEELVIEKSEGLVSHVFHDRQAVIDFFMK